MGGSALGFAYFAGVKAIGYTAAAPVLKKAYGLGDSPRPRVITIGLTRTAIGVVAGLLYGGMWLFFGESLRTNHPTPAFFLPIAFFGLLLPIRLAEWSLLISIFLDRKLKNRSLWWKAAFAGSGWSYCLDVIGVIAAFVIPGGVWIC
jgi:hypothetical protein